MWQNPLEGWIVFTLCFFSKFSVLNSHTLIKTGDLFRFRTSKVYIIFYSMMSPVSKLSVVYNTQSTFILLHYSGKHNVQMFGLRSY